MTKEKTSTSLELVAGFVLAIGAIGSIFGLESNILSQGNIPIRDTSFQSYLDQGKKQYGDKTSTYALAVWTYPGARMAAEINNSIICLRSKNEGE